MLSQDEKARNLAGYASRTQVDPVGFLRDQIEMRERVLAVAVKAVELLANSPDDEDLLESRRQRLAFVSPSTAPTIDDVIDMLAVAP